MAGCQMPARPLSLPLLSKAGEKTQWKSSWVKIQTKIDTDREIPYLLPPQVKQIQLGEK